MCDLTDGSLQQAPLCLDHLGSGLSEGYINSQSERAGPSEPTGPSTTRDDTPSRDVSDWVPAPISEGTASLYPSNPLGLLLEVTRDCTTLTTSKPYVVPLIAENSSQAKPAFVTNSNSGHSEHCSLLGEDVDSIVSSRDVDQLVTRYYQTLHPSVPILCPELHTVSNLRERSALLLIA
jgi:hypothetical protein